MPQVVEEIAAAISINQVNYAVMMITPDNIEDFVVGFLFSESIIEHAHDVHDIEFASHPLGLNINIKLSNRCMHTLAVKQRSLKGTSGCGICGSQALEHAFPDIAKLTSSTPYTIAQPQQFKQTLKRHQLKAQVSGALHAAFWLDQNNQVLACREDIGRHNALDKIIGVIKTQKCTSADLTQHALLVTSRCSAELIQKAVKIAVPTLISLASPSTLAIRLAEQYKLNLIHIPKRDDLIYYPAKQPSISERITTNDL